MVIFISGHRDITIDEFYKHYELPICSALGEYGDDVSFVRYGRLGSGTSQNVLRRHVKDVFAHLSI